jgi:SAM-dependent methyltransferase
MADYDKTFAKRGREYKYAVETYPNALRAEFQTAADVVLSTNPTSVLNIPAACVPLHTYLPSTLSYTALESNKDFADMTHTPYATLSNIPLPSASIDTIVSLASLHHASHKERHAFYTECLRILHPGGRLVIGDVVAGSRQDEWLNVFVNHFNSAGHAGIFWSKDDCELMKTAGFDDVDFSIHSYSWDFKDQTDMLDFCRHLFGLDTADDHSIKTGLQTYLDASQTQIPWTLGYFVATKSPKQT